MSVRTSTGIHRQVSEGSYPCGHRGSGFSELHANDGLLVKRPRRRNSTLSIATKARAGEAWAWTRCLDGAVKPFLKSGDSVEKVRQKILMVKPMMIMLPIATGFTVGQRIIYPFDDEDPQVRLFLHLREALSMAMVLILSCGLALLYRFGLRTILKVGLVVAVGCWIVLAALLMPSVSWEMSFILLLDVTLVLRSAGDRLALNSLAGIQMCAFLVLATVKSAEWEHSVVCAWSEVEKAVGYSAPLIGFVQVAPVALNFIGLNDYVLSFQQEAEKVNSSIELTYDIAEKLANYDLDAAQELLCSANMAASHSRMAKPLAQVLKNLKTYRAFLPNALFGQKRVDDELTDEPLPNEALATAMRGKTPAWDLARTCVNMLREPSYSLLAFQEDLEEGFPELKLYETGTGESISGLTNHEELLRTMGALFSVYSIARIDMDGKEIFSFGVDAHGEALGSPSGEGAERKQEFHEKMLWDRFLDLFIRAELLSRDDDGCIEVNEERMTAFLYLTVVHDVMKNAELLPRVQAQHSPYNGVLQGEVLEDHDAAIAYIMDKFPWLLPTFSDLSPQQRAPILFAQSTMGFNNGWLVQGEAPPGLLFSTFRRIILEGRASESDVSFYFAHWLTDLAGAQPFAEEEGWPGAEKFTLKFPQRVLLAFLDSFSFVDQLATRSEVDVMESYLCDRWQSLGPPAESVPDHGEIAAMRIALMAQGFEREAVEAFSQLPLDARQTLVTELARTGCRSQYSLAPPSLSPQGPAICVYYSPALLQKAGVAEIRLALLILAAVLKAARSIFELDVARTESTSVVRIDKMKVLCPSDILKHGPWYLQQTGHQDAVAEQDGEISRRQTSRSTFKSGRSGKMYFRRVPIVLPLINGEEMEMENQEMQEGPQVQAPAEEERAQAKDVRVEGARAGKCTFQTSKEETSWPAPTAPHIINVDEHAGEYSVIN